MALKPSHIASHVINQTHQIEVHWQDGQSSVFHGIWLQDSCRCERCFQADTLSINQNHLENMDLDASIALANINAEGDIDITFDTLHGSHSSTFNASWLRAHSHPETSTNDTVVYWHNGFRLPEFDWSDDVFYDDEVQLKSLNILKHTGAFIVRNVPVTEEAFVDAVERVGLLRQRYHPSFVFKMDSSNSLAKKIQASYQDDLENHTDHTAYDYPAKIQFLHCAKYLGKPEDAVSTLCDGFYVARQLQQQDPEAYALLSEQIIPACRRRFLVEEGEQKYVRKYEWESYHANKVLHHDADGTLHRISFNHNTRAPLQSPDKDPRALYSAYLKFHRLINDAENNIRFKLNPGDMVVMDNHRTVHGRSRYDSNTTSRILHGAYLSKEVFESRWRLLTGATTQLDDKWLTGCSNEVLSNLAERFQIAPVSHVPTTVASAPKVSDNTRVAS